MGIRDWSPREYSPAERIRRGQAAERLMEDELLQGVLEEAEYNFAKRWLEGEDERDHATCRAAIHALEEVQRVLRRIVSEGVVAATEENRRNPRRTI